MSQGAISVANFFIQRGLDDDDNLTPMKLLKLVYIAHGWHLGLYDTPLIGENVEAWKFGPVVRGVYKSFNEYGSGRVSEVCGSRTVDGAEHPFLEKIWNVYKVFDGIKLSAKTHQPGTPWAIITEPYKKGELPHGLLIPNSLIGDYYKKLANIGGGA